MPRKTTFPLVFLLNNYNPLPELSDPGIWGHAPPFHCNVTLLKITRSSAVTKYIIKTESRIGSCTRAVGYLAQTSRLEDRLADYLSPVFSEAAVCTALVMSHSRHFILGRSVKMLTPHVFHRLCCIGLFHISAAARKFGVWGITQRLFLSYHYHDDKIRKSERIPTRYSSALNLKSRNKINIDLKFHTEGKFATYADKETSSQIKHKMFLQPDTTVWETHIPSS